MTKCARRRKADAAWLHVANLNGAEVGNFPGIAAQQHVPPELPKVARLRQCLLWKIHLSIFGRELFALRVCRSSAIQDEVDFRGREAGELAEPEISKFS